MKTLEQRRAESAWACLTTPGDTGWKGPDPDRWKGDTGAKKYLGALKKTPARIHACGLGQALAFLSSRKDAQGKAAGADLSRLVLDLLGVYGNNNLLQEIRNKDLSFLIAATDETVKVCAWLMRYLEGAGVKGDDNDDDGGGNAQADAGG